MKKSFLTILSLLLFVLPVTLLGQGNISGTVIYQNVNEDPIIGATVIAYNQNGIAVGQTTTDTLGYYSFNSLPYGDYTIEVSHNSIEGGITLEDAFLVLQYIQGYATLTPLQLKAADVDFNDVINMMDVTEIIRRYILQILQFNQKWVFETINVTVDGNKDGDGDSRVRGSCTGDVSGSYSPPQTKTEMPELTLKSQESLTLSTKEISSIPLKFKDFISVQGLGLILNYPESAVKIEGIKFNDPAYSYNVINGQIRIAWRDTNYKPLTLMPEEVFAMVYLTAKTNKFSTKENVYEFTLSKESEIVNENKNFTSTEINLPKLIITDESDIISSVWPNPATTESNIKLNISNDGNLIVKLYDINGKEVKDIYNNFTTSGEHEINFITSDLVNGKYFIHLNYQSNGNNYNDIRKLNIIK